MARSRRVLRGRVAVITGGGSGIGRGIALALARRGAWLVLAGRGEAALAAVVHEATALGARAVAVPVDITVPADRLALLARTQDSYGRLDVLVQCAGALVGGALTDMASGDVERLLRLNLEAPVALTHAAVPELIARRGAVVCIASTMALVPMPYAAVYAASKCGVRGFADALRYELSPHGVQVLTVYPATTDTAMVAGMARAAGLPGYRSADPLVVGEQIARALQEGRDELVLGAGERAISVLYRLAPGLARRLIAGQRARFQRMMRATRAGP